MRIITAWIKFRRAFTIKRVRRTVKKTAISAFVLVLAVITVSVGTRYLPDLMINLTAVSSVLALPEGTQNAVEKFYNREDINADDAEPPSEEIPPESSQAEASSVSQAVSNAVVEQNTDAKAPSFDVKKEDRKAIISETFDSHAAANGVEYKAGSIRNYTKKSQSDIEKILSKDWGETLSNDPNTVQVLIMHTHTTESYEPCDRDYYDVNYTARTLDEEYNMVKVGNMIAKTLSENNIGVVHDTTVHDYPSYNGSYERSAETVEKWLKKYPSIKVVLDIHRDAIERTVSGETVRVKPVVEIDGQKAAQLMIIAGCDDGSMDMPNWKENLRLAAALQNQLETDSKGITRPVMFCYRRYNQNLTTGSLLVEVGGHANSLDEAVYSGKLLGESLAELLKTYMR